MSIPKTDYRTGSQQVSFLAVHDFVRELLAQVNSFPAAGTPAWCSLAHDDPRKLAAVVDAGQHHVLRVELAQEARAEASRDVADAADWSAAAQAVAHGRGDSYIARAGS